MMNKLTLLVRDEEGMTLVELLAVIVILSIVAAIGGVAIAGVIQRSREDGRVADIQMLYEAATLAETSDAYISKDSAGKTAKDLNDAGYATSVNFLTDSAGATTAAGVRFTVVAGTGGGVDKLVVTIPEKSMYAGSKGNVALNDKDAKGIKGLTRDTLFNGSPSPSPSPSTN